MEETPWGEMLKQLEVRDVLEKRDSKYFEAFSQLSQHLEIMRAKCGPLVDESPPVSSATSPSPTPSLITSSKNKEKSESPQSNDLVALIRLNQELQAKNRNLILTLNQTTINLEKAELTINLNKRTIANLEQSVDKLSQKVTNLNLEVREKNKSIEIINDELLSNQIQINVLNGDIQNLKQENETLIERWMDKVKKDAEKLNDANEFLESIKK